MLIALIKVRVFGSVCELDVVLMIFSNLLRGILMAVEIKRNQVGFLT